MSVKNIKKIWQTWKKQIVSIVIGFVLCGLASSMPTDSVFSGKNEIARSGYGSSSSSYQLMVSGISDEPQAIYVEVSDRKYTDENVSAAFDECMDYVTSNMLGENASLIDIESDINLPEKVSEYGMKIMWSSSEPDIVSYSGEVVNTQLEAAVDVTLTARISDGNKHEATYEIPITVLPKSMSEEERRLMHLAQAIEDADTQQSTLDTFTLPTKFDGYEVSYFEKKDESYTYIAFLGIVAAVIFWLQDQMKEKNAREDRIRQMQLDYPEIVSKLMVFLGAGMTVRLAFANIVGDYEKDKVETRYAYEEMAKAYNQMKAGANEGQVYKDFGRACGCKQYMKLASLLEQNRKTGLDNIKELLSIETVEAWEERKNLARRLGEEASTKLLLPLFLLLGVVMVIIMVPAFMSM